MKTAGDILSALFDERFVQKAQGYSKFYDSWKDITEKNGIAAAAAHSRIKDLDRGIVLVEMDHPGWKQILQTKQTKLLNDFRIRFPELDISGISLMLGRSDPHNNLQPEKEPEIPPVEKLWKHEPSPALAETDKPAPQTEPVSAGYDAIKDDEFREKLIKLGQAIAESERSAGQK